MLSDGGITPVEATVASDVTAVLEPDELGAVGCTMLDEAGRPPVEATTVGMDELGDVGDTISEAGGRLPVEAALVDTAMLEEEELDVVVLIAGGATYVVSEEASVLEVVL